jgi:RsiW-degrading membrane proteinase PrsW (M82 family)
VELYRLPLYILFGILPSLIWLFYYLKKDLHPEPKKMILKIFLYGSLITIPVFFIQIGLSFLLHQLQVFISIANHPVIFQVIKWFFVIAFTEELCKYLVFRFSVLKNLAFDEPLDSMIYLVTAALGFAAVENILYLFSPIGDSSFQTIVQTAIMITIIRFIGATFLHTLCSALLGYIIAISLFETKKRVLLTILGIIIVVVLHGMYDFSIVTLQSPAKIIIPIAIILGLTLFTFFAFNKAKHMKSVSKI